MNHDERHRYEQAHLSRRLDRAAAARAISPDWTAVYAVLAHLGQRPERPIASANDLERLERDGWQLRGPGGRAPRDPSTPSSSYGRLPFRAEPPTA